MLVDESGGIIAGHGRVMAAVLLGLPDVPVMTARLNVSDTTVRQIANGRRNMPDALLPWLRAVVNAVDALGLPDGWAIMHFAGTGWE